MTTNTTNSTPLSLDTILKAKQYVQTLKTRTNYNLFNGKKAYADIRDSVLDCSNILDCLIATGSLEGFIVTADTIRAIRSINMLRGELDRLEWELELLEKKLHKDVEAELLAQEQSIIDSCVQDAVEGNKAPLAHIHPLFDAYRSVPVNADDTSEGYYRLHWMANTDLVLVTMPWCSARLIVNLRLDNTTGFYDLMVRTVLSDGSVRELVVGSIHREYKPLYDATMHLYDKGEHKASYKSLRSVVYHLVRTNGKFALEWNDIVYYMFNGKMPSTTA